MSDVMLRARPSRSQKDAAPPSQTELASIYPANDPFPPPETTVHPIAVMIMYFSLFAGGGSWARDVRIGRSRRRSFREFLDGDVEIWTGRITGRQALEQMATLPITLAIGGSAIIAAAIMARS